MMLRCRRALHAKWNVFIAEATARVCNLFHHRVNLKKSIKMEYNYRLVVFINKRKTKQIDIVPSTWLYSDKSVLLCKFMPGPYNNERSKKLLHILKNGSSPEEDWPSYPVELVGRACK